MSEDMNRPATHGDVIAVKKDVIAVKNDVIGVKKDIVAVKKDFEQKLVNQKNELKEDIRRLAVVVSKIRGELFDATHELSNQIREGNNRILNALSYFSGKVQTIDRREIITSNRVDKLENRVTSLEEKLRQ